MNKYLIDTSSLLILTRYFNPFDKKFFHDWLKKMFFSEDFIFLDSVKSECKKVSKGVVLSEYSFLDSDEIKKKTLKSEEIISPKIHNKIDNNWATNNQKKLSENVYDGEKNKFISSADCQLIICALQNKVSSSNYIVVTEESSYSNDNKLFKKLPLICNDEQIQCLNITEVLKRFIEIDFHII